MSSARFRWATMGTAAATLLLLSAFVASKKVNSVPFTLADAGVSVLLLCVLDQFLFAPDGRPGFLRWFGTGVLRGGLIGLVSWLGMMTFVRIFTEVGDKFPLFVIGFLPIALAFGAVAEGLSCGVSYGVRFRQYEPDDYAELASKLMETNRRQQIPLAAIQKVGRDVHARPALRAAVAHLKCSGNR